MTFHGEGNEAPGARAGDVNVKISIKDHPTFVRKGADLYMAKKITLLEALTGANFKIRHLDGTEVTIASSPTDVIGPKTIKVVQGKGMPFYQDSISHGNLIIQFDVEFPTSGSIKKEHREVLKGILPGPKVKEAPGMDYCLMEDFDESMQNNSHEGGRGNPYAQEEEDARGGQRVGCGAQ